MTIPESASLDLLVSDGDPAFAGTIGEALEETPHVATAETDFAADGIVARSQQIGADGVVIGDTIEEVGETIEEITNQTDLPVILLSDPSNEETIGDAIAAGVTDVFPRAASKSQFELITRRIADAGKSEGDSLSATELADEGVYRELFENVSDGLVVHDPGTGEIVDVDEQFCEIHGYERDELVGETIGIVTTPGGEYSYDAARNQVEKAREDGPQVVEWTNQRKTGETFPVEVTLVVKQVGGVERVLASVKDITERHHREGEFEAIFNGVHDQIAVFDPETYEMVAVNERMAEVTGYDRERILDERNLVSATDEGYDYSRAKELIDEVASTSEPKEIEWRLETADGERRIQDVRVNLVTIEGEERVVTNNRDVTERRRREREFEQIFDGVHDGIIVMDSETLEIKKANRQYLDLVGYDDLEALQQQGVEGLSVTGEGYTVERARDIHRRVSDSGEAEIFEWRIETAASERRWLEVKIAPAVIGGEDVNIAIHRDITERKRREREYEQIFNSIQDAITVHDPETYEMVDVNDTFCEFTGYDRETILEIGTSGVSVAAEGYTEERAKEIIEEVLRDGQKGPFEWMVETKDGEHRVTEVVATKGEIGGESRIISINRDITERKRREREYEQIFNNVQDAIIIHDPETYEMVDVNDTFCEFTGYDRETILEIGTSGVSVAAEGYTEKRAEEIIEEVLRDGQKGPYEWIVETKDGEQRVTESVATTGEIGGEPRIISINRDITERKRREQEYEQIFNMAGDGIVIHDPESGEIVDANQQVANLLGYDRQAFFDQRISEFQATNESFTGQQAREKIQESAKKGGQEFEWALETSDGETVWVRARHETGQIDGEQRIVALLHDITERKRRERIIRSLHDATDQLQEAKTREAVCEATVAAAETVLGLSLSGCWLPDENGSLRPAAGTDGFWQVPGGAKVFEESSFEYDVYDADELVTYEPTEWGEQNPFGRMILVPLGNHALLGAGDSAAEPYDEVTLDAARILARHARSALDRVERARELRKSERRFRTIAERVDEIIYLADTDTMEVLYLSPGHKEVWGRSLEDVYDDPTAFTDAIHPDDIDSFEADRQAMLNEIEARESDDNYEFSYRIERPDGELRWIKTTGYPIIGEQDEPDRYVAMVKDVTEQHRREQTLETFHQATRELTGAESRREACKRAIEAAEEVLGFPLVTTYLYDEETGELTPRAITSRLDELNIEPPSFGPGDSLPWQVFVQGESTTSSEGVTTIYGSGISGPDIVLPLGSHGVMLVGDPTESFDSEDIELAQILAATLEAALNHVAGEQTLEERNEELQRQQERAERLEQLNAIIRDIEQATVEQSSRAGIEEAVCERLSDVDAHDLVWIAEPAVGDDELIPQTRAGTSESYVDAIVDVLRNGSGGHPAVEAYRSDEPRVVENVATDVPANEWRKTALQHGIQSIVSLPIRYESKTHGVLTVASAEPGTFDVATQEVLSDLSRSIGYAITISEREHALESKGTTELEFTIRDTGLLLVRASSTASCRIQLQRTIRRSGGSFSTFYVVEGADVDDIVNLANSSPGIETAQVVSTNDTGDEALIEVAAPTWFGSVFTEHGAVVREATSEGGEGTLIVETPRGTDVRTLVEAFQERYPDTEFTAQHQRDRSVSSLFELQDILQDELTDRQWEALETAYSAGYFDWPREVKSEQAADLLDISQPTFNKHLRIAEKQAFEMLLEREYHH